MSTPATYLEYSDREHRYFADGKELRSVTQVLDAAGLISQFCKDDEAAARGTEVHRLCALDDEHRLDLRTVPVQLRGYLRAWRKYRQDTGFKPYLIEHRVDCLEYGYSGRFDRLGYTPGGIGTVLDIKTSKSGAVPAYARLQLVAYGLAYDHRRVFERTAVSLRPGGKYNCRNYSIADYFIDRAEWLSILKTTKEQNNGHS
jgi:hypothetical protein